MKIDMCADLGEGYGNYSIANDEGIISTISSANIACGFHAGDPRTMNDAVQESIKHKIGIGAHPGYPDRVGFGRRNMDLSYQEVLTDTLYQIGALDSFLKFHGGKLQHVFPHGQFGLRANDDKEYAEAMVEAVAKYSDSLIMMTQKGELEIAARKKGLRVAIPIFADRAYGDDGQIVQRSVPGAVLDDPDLIVKRAVKMVVESKVTSINGNEIALEGHTLLIHGDTTGSLEIAQMIRSELLNNDVLIKPLGEWLT